MKIVKEDKRESNLYSKGIMMTFKQLLGICLCILISYPANAESKMLAENIHLLLTVASPHVEAGASIEMELKLENRDNKDIEYIVTKQRTPYSVSLINESGHDLLAKKFSKYVKDHKNPGRNVILAAGDSIAYRPVIKPADMVEKMQPSKSYSLTVTYAITQYIDGNYEVTLVESEPVILQLAE